MKWWNRWLTDDKRANRTAPLIEELEPRVLLSADAAGIFAPDPGAVQPQAPTELLLDDKLEPAPAEQVAQGESRHLELVFVDTNSPDYRSIVDSLTEATDDNRQFEVILLDNNRDGVWQISRALQSYSDVDAIHLVSHGDTQGVDLGDTRLDAASLQVQQDQFLAWADHLADDADILIYGCNLAGADTGLSLMREIAQLTGADVAASEDLTGHESLGGNWVLEARVGAVDTQVFASQGLLESYRATLAAPVANDDDGQSYEDKITGVSDGYFQLDDVSDIADETAGGNDGSAIGGVSNGAGSATSSGGGSIDFDNSNTGYISIPHSSDYELTQGAISLWFNSTTIVDMDSLFSKDASGTAEGGHLSIYFTGNDASAEIEVRLQNNTASGTDSHFVQSDLPNGYLNDGNWHNLVFTFGPGGMALYIDGAAADTTGGNAHLDIYDGGMIGDTGLQGDGGDVANQEPIYLGASRRSSGSGVTPPSGNFFEGSIDEFAIVNQQLTAAQVADLYRTAGAPYVIDEDNTLSTTAAEGVLANDFDADGDPLTASLVSGPSNAESFTLNSDGSFSYTPQANFSGTDSFVYRADDGNGGVDTATATITINAVAEDPSLWDYHQTVLLDTPTPSTNYLVEVSLSNAVGGFQYGNADANGDDLRFYDNTGNELAYWIETWNASGTSTVWVEVADAGTSSFDFYYGNPTAIASSDQRITYAFFDDFSGATAGALPSGWALGTEAQDGTLATVEDDGTGNLVFYDGQNGAEGGEIVHGGSWTDLSVQQDFRVPGNTDPVADATLVLRYADGNNAIAAGIYSADEARFWYTTNTSGGWVEFPASRIDLSVPGFGLDPMNDGNWHTQEARLVGDTLTLYIDGVEVGSVDLTTAPVSDLPTSGAAGFWSQDGNAEGYRDNHIVRDLISPGPSIVATLLDEGFRIDENSADATVVGKVLAEDVDGDALTFTIAGGNTGTAFAIDSTGQITVANSGAVNFEVNPAFALTVEVDDGTGRTATTTVHIALNDVNDPAVGPVPVVLLDDDGDGLPEQGERLWQTWVASDEDGVPGTGWDITWLRDGVPIPGATGIIYTLAQEDVGAQITSTVSYTDLGGNPEYLASTPTAAIGNINDLPTGSVTVSGVAEKDEMLTASDNLDDIDGMGTITYHWQRDTGSGFVDIGATGTSYTLTAADIGARVRAEARFQDGEGTDESVAGNSVGPVALGRGADITSIETADLNEDGFIDAIRVSFDDAIQDSTVRADDFDVAGVGGESFSSTTNSDVAGDNDIYITFTDGVLSTGETPEVTYLGDSPTDPDILDSSNNAVADFVAWWNSDWQNRTRIDINNGNSASDVNGFPLLVELTGSKIDFNLISPGGADVRFTDRDGTELPYTIEHWDDGSETARIWVRIPQLDAGAADEAIYLYHNNGAAGHDQDAAAVWSDGLGVYHFNEDPGPGTAGDILDSSSPANHGTAEASMTVDDLVGGRVGTGIEFDEIDDNINFGSVDVGDTFTLSAWIRPDSAGNGIQTILANSNQGASAAGFRFFINSSGTEDGSIHFETGNGTNGNSAISSLGVINFDQWNHVAVEVNRSTGNATIYHNGVGVTADSTIRTDFTISSDFRVGQMEGDSLEFNGVIDELRVESVGQSADFIQARYLSQIAGSTFTRFGATESQTGDAAAPVVTITRDNGNPSAAASVSFSVDFSEAVGNVTADDFVITTSGTVTTNPTVAVNNAGDGDDSTYQVTVTGIAGDGTLGLELSGGQNIVDSAGNLASTNLLANEFYTIDNTAPGAVSVTGISNDTNIAADGTTSDNQLVFSGSAEANSVVEVFIDGGSIGTTSADGSGNWSFDHTATTLADASYTVTSRAADTAGNTGAISAVFSLTVDTVNPTAPSGLGISSDTGDADNITSDNQLVLSGSAEANSTVEVFLDSGGGPVSIATVSADGAGNWTVDYTTTTLADGNYTLTAQATDLAGNISAVSIGLAFEVDTAGPAATATAISDDTGAADLITSDNQLVFSGTAEASNSVEVFLNGASLGSVIADGSGNWSLDYTGITLVDGSYTLTARATDANTGQAGALSSGLAFEVDTTGPAATVTAISDDTGAADLITLDNQLIFSGTAEADNSVEVFLDGASLGLVTADGSGNWSLDYTGTTLADGSHTLTAQATDLATGQAGALSVALSFSIDTSAPAATVSAISDDTNIATDGVTSDNQLVFSGTAEANNSVEVFLDGASLGSVTADGSGIWSLDHTGTILADGSYTLTARATDSATGQVGVLSGGFTFTVDSTAPAAPTVVSLSDDTGAADLVTRDNQLEFAGVAESNSSVEVFLDGSSIGTTSADATGTWSFDHSGTTLADGVYTLTAEATDLAGNTSTLSAGLNFTVDTTPPPNNDPNGGVSIDNTTPAQGDVLTASNDIDDPDGLDSDSISYHWQRDTGSGFVDIGTTGATYTATQDDVGATLRVEARYTDIRGFDETVSSESTAAVANVDDIGSGEVSIDNLNPVQGDTLTASNTLDDPDGLSGTVAYQWQRDGEDIPGQNGTIYVTTQADVGAVIGVIASYIDDLGGTGTEASVSTAPVGDINDAPTGSVVILGGPTEDQTLTASNTLGDADGVGTVSYQWLRDGADITGATGDTYTLGQADVGARISVLASYTDGASNTEAIGSEATAIVANVNDEPSGALLSKPADAAPGTVLSTINDLVDEDGISGPVSFQWMRNGESIDGATGDSYTLTEQDAGASVTVVASYTDDYGTDETLESAGVVVSNNSTPDEDPLADDTSGSEGDTAADESGDDVGDATDGVTVFDEPTNDDSGSPAPPAPPAGDDAVSPPAGFEFGDPALDNDISTDPILVLGDNLDFGNRTGTGSSALDLSESDSVDSSDEAETDASIADAERERGLVEDLLQLLQDGDTEEDITLASGNAIGITLEKETEADEELAVVDDILTNHALWDAIDRMNEEFVSQSDNKLTREELIVQFVSTSGLGLFAAFTVYALRGGALMASWLSTVPLWGTLDPLPVLGNKKGKQQEELDNREKSARERKAESLFSGQESA